MAGKFFIFFPTEGFKRKQKFKPNRNQGNQATIEQRNFLLLLLTKTFEGAKMILLKNLGTGSKGSKGQRKMKEDNQEMAQMNEFKGTGTSVRHENGKTVFKYHNTDICSLDANTITLNSGGYHTSATKIHLNQISNQYGLGYWVSQRHYDWFVDYNGKRFDFKDGMVLSR